MFRGQNYFKILVSKARLKSSSIFIFKQIQLLNHLVSELIRVFLFKCLEKKIHQLQDQDDWVSRSIFNSLSKWLDFIFQTFYQKLCRFDN